MALCPGLPGWAGTRKVKPIWILLKQETVSGSSISWAIWKSAPRTRQITTPAPHYSVFYRPDVLPATQPTASKHWRHKGICYINLLLTPTLTTVKGKLCSANRPDTRTTMCKTGHIWYKLLTDARNLNSEVKNYSFVIVIRQVWVQIPTYADNEALPAFVRHCCWAPTVQQSIGVSCPLSPQH